MIFVSYPLGTGGNFVASLLALLINNHHNQILSDGSMHKSLNGYEVFNLIRQDSLSQIQRILRTTNSAKSIMIGHLLDVKSIIELSSDICVIYITVTDPKWIGIQQKNFLKKVISQYWSEELYQRFAGNSWPKFDSILSNMPQWVIDDMMNINLKYITSWKPILPEDHARCLELPMELTVRPSLLLSRIVTFFNLNPTEEQYQQALDLINNYIKINNYE